MISSFTLNEFPFIHHLELLTVLLAIRLWGHQWCGLRILVHCDNAAVVSSLNSGCVQDPLLAACLHELWFLVASYEFELWAVHLPSADNRLADLLSLSHLHPMFQAESVTLAGSSDLLEMAVPYSYFHVADCL